MTGFHTMFSTLGKLALATTLAAGALVAPAVAAAPFDQAMSIVSDPKALATRSGEAEQLFRQCLSGAPDNVEGWFNLGLLLERKGDLAGARDAYQKALGVKADYLPAQARIAGLDLAAGNTAALDKLEAIIKEDAFQAEARNILAEYALAQGDYAKAILHSRNVLVGDPRNVNASLNAAIAYYRQGLIDQAGLIATSALEKEPNAAALHNIMGLVYLSKDDTRSATEQFTAALDGDPNNMDALLNLAALELAYGNFESALKHFDQALKIRPRDAGVVLSRGVALRGLERFDEAQAAYEQALTLKPGFIDAEYNLCVLNHQFKSDWAQAKRWCSTYLGHIDAANPKYKEVQKRLKAAEATLKILQEKTGPGAGGGTAPAP
ncbi:MAG: tetratricopeptide repeat protein [Myxococcales bacterium]|nr:tetratricopeptide repeat protein [Myxococcales bacterium]MCB9733040.1 tetratricopeptide repeat protein [Deltaproteobacteria bacterium]